MAPRMQTQQSPHQHNSPWILYLAMLTVGMGQTVIFAVMPMLGRELALDKLLFSLPGGFTLQPKELTITALSALTALTFSLISPFWGRLSDRVGRKPVIIIGLLGYTLGVTLFNAAAYAGLIAIITGSTLYAWLLITRIIHASVMSAAFPAASAYVVDNTPIAKRTQGLSKLSAAMQLGVMIGPALAYLVSYSYLMPFFVQSLFTLCAAALVFAFLPKSPATDTSTTHTDTFSAKLPAKLPTKLHFWDPRYRLYLIQALAVYICMGMVQQTLGFYFQDVLHIDGPQAARQYSMAMVMSSAAMLFTQLILVQTLNFSPQRYIKMGVPFFIAGFALITLAQSQATLIAGMGLFGIGMGFCGPSFSAAASLTVSGQEQGALAGLIGSVAGLGFVIGPLLGGFLYAINTSYPYACATLIAIGLLVLVLTTGKQHSNSR